MRDLSDPIALDKRKNHTIEAVVDRILLKTATDTARYTRQAFT